MIKIDRINVYNFEGSFHGMRNPKESWKESDSKFGMATMDDMETYLQDVVELYFPYEEFQNLSCDKQDEIYDCFTGKINLRSDEDNEIVDYACIGPKDLKLAQSLILAGTDESKFLRQIFVSMDITGPTYFDAELDTYKIGTTRNSCSLQHKGSSRAFSIRDFSIDDTRIYDVLDPIKIKKEYPLFFPYETEEFKCYQVGERRYKVFKNGRIFAEKFGYTDTMGRNRIFEEKEIVVSQNPFGYRYCNLGGRKNRERWLVHRLIAELWIDKKESTLEVNHKDGNKGNNSVENIEWITHQENEIHKHQNNLDGETISTQYLKFKSSCKIEPPDRLLIKKLYSSGEYNQKQISEKYNISQSQVSAIINNKYTSNNYELFEQCWYWEEILKNINSLRERYNETQDYEYFRQMRQIIPMGYNYKFTWTANYQVLRAIYFARKNHRLSEWKDFCHMIEGLPWGKELACITKEDLATTDQKYYLSIAKE